MRHRRRILSGLVVATALLVPSSAAAAQAGVPQAVPSSAVSDAAGSGVTTTVVPMATGDSISFTGHGWGHGRGMGQYGALGYAVDHGWSWQQILEHYYGGASLAGDAGDPAMSVELVRLTDADTILQGYDLKVNGVAVPGSYDYVRIWRAGDGTLRADSAPSCAGPWTSFGGSFGTSAGVAATRDQSQPVNLVRTCEVGISIAYRGTIRAVVADGRRYTINDLPTETYLRGVVPRESPASWGDLGSRKGMQALQAQAVAARSYALAGGARTSGAKTCDTTSCQVYGGAYESSTDGPGATLTAREEANTNQAVAATAGQVMRPDGKPTQVARTEFSSSTGGWTTGGTFPPVEDLGDDISLNPNHDWYATFTEAAVAAKVGLPGIRSITVTQRNGLGDLGGRVLAVVVTGTNGVQKPYTGAEFRTLMGTGTFKSDWFAVATMTRAEAEAVVTALYQDLLGRAPDPTGLSTWSTKLMTGSQSELVGTLTRSEEYIKRRITQAYTEVLGRSPEPSGMAYWYDAILHQRATVDDVKRRFYDSQEYYLRSGGTDTGYIALLYRTMFEREGTSSEITYWSSRIPTMGRSAVVDAIWFSMEAAMYRAAGYYRLFLDREAEWAGKEYWATVLLASGEGAVRQGIAGSTEYRLLAIKNYG